MAPRIVLRVAKRVSRTLAEQQVAHALAGGLAVGLHGYNRMTTDVEFVVCRTARQAIEQLGPTTPKAGRLKGISVTLGRVDVHFSFVGEPVRRADIAYPLHLVGLPIIGIDPLVAMKVGANRSRDTVDVVELLKLGQISIEDVSKRLSGEDLEQFQDLVAISDLEKAGKPKEGRRILMAVLARSARIELKSPKIRAVK